MERNIERTRKETLEVVKLGDLIEKLINFYESGDNTDLKEWFYETSIDGIQF